MLSSEGMRRRQHCFNNIYLMPFFQIRGCSAEKETCTIKKKRMWRANVVVWFWKIGSKSGPHQTGLGKSGVSNSGISAKNMKHIDLMLSKLWRVLMITKRLCYEDRSENWFWWYQLPVGFSDPGFQSTSLAQKKQWWSGLSYATLWAEEMLRCEKIKCCAVRAWEGNNIVQAMLISCSSFRLKDVM